MWGYMPISPDQCRAARALLGWTQDDLETAARVAKKSIADFERGAQIPFKRSLDDIQAAFEANGVQLIPENGGGAGVRLKVAIARLIRKRISRFDHVASLAISYRDKEYRVQLSTDILDDIDRTNHRTDLAIEKSADAHMNVILIRAAAAIDAGRADEQGNILLSTDDFPEAGPTRRRGEL